MLENLVATLCGSQGAVGGEPSGPDAAAARRASGSSWSGRAAP